MAKKRQILRKYIVITRVKYTICLLQKREEYGIKITKIRNRY